jgi:hypothetical protein
VADLFQQLKKMDEDATPKVNVQEGREVLKSLQVPLETFKAGI